MEKYYYYPFVARVDLDLEFVVKITAVSAWQKYISYF